MTHPLAPILCVDRPDDFSDLVLRYLEGDMSEEQGASMRASLQASASLRQLFVLMCYESRLIAEAARAKTDNDQLAGPRAGGVWWLRLGYAAAAALVIMALTLGAFLQRAQHSDEAWLVGMSDGRRGVAMLSDRSDDAKFDGEPLALGENLPAGLIHLTTGRAQVVFKSSAVVDLNGPCAFEMTGVNRGRLNAGQIEAYVRPEAHGFTVDVSDDARVIDLGTRFELTALPKLEPTVLVTEGRVRVESGTQTAIMHIGQVGRLSENGWVVSNVSPSGIASHSPNVRLVYFPPVRLSDGGLDSDTDLFVMAERRGVDAGRRWVAVTQTGQFTLGTGKPGQLPPDAIVDSYLLHADAVAESGATIDASVTFDRPVLGVILAEGLNTSDSELALPDEPHEAFDHRGPERDDHFTLSEDRKTVTIHFQTTTPDEIRVLIRSAVDRKAGASAP
ncbi:MAG: hypothetical protein GC162_02095 [Planctomycetes bacterium]|nr:hypothetical protein [Planctomycetota bacterium]